MVQPQDPQGWCKGRSPVPQVPCKAWGFVVPAKVNIVAVIRSCENASQRSASNDVERRTERENTASGTVEHGPACDHAHTDHTLDCRTHDIAGACGIRDGELGHGWA